MLAVVRGRYRADTVGYSSILERAGSWGGISSGTTGPGAGGSTAGGGGSTAA